MPRLTRAEAAYLLERGGVVPVRPKRARVRPPRGSSLSLFGTDLAQWPFTIPADQVVCRFEIDGDPISKARPRVAPNGHVYTPATTVKWEKRIRARLAVTPRERVRLGEAIGIRIRFHTDPAWRRDCDNLTKAILDSFNTVVWPDDKQVDQLHVEVERGVDEPRTEALVYRLAWLVEVREAV